MAGEDQKQPEGAGVPVEYDAEKELSKITEECLKAKGFVVFAAVLTDEKNRDGNFMLRFTYSRHKYPYEDLRKAIQDFQRKCEEDVLGMMRGGNGR